LWAASESAGRERPVQTSGSLRGDDSREKRGEHTSVI